MGVVHHGIAPPPGILAGVAEGLLGLDGQTVGSNHEVISSPCRGCFIPDTNVGREREVSLKFLIESCGCPVGNRRTVLLCLNDRPTRLTPDGKGETAEGAMPTGGLSAARSSSVWYAGHPRPAGNNRCLE